MRAACERACALSAPRGGYETAPEGEKLTETSARAPTGTLRRRVVCLSPPPTALSTTIHGSACVLAKRTRRRANTSSCAHIVTGTRESTGVDGMRMIIGEVVARR